MLAGGDNESEFRLDIKRAAADYEANPSDSTKRKYEIAVATYLDVYASIISRLGRSYIILPEGLPRVEWGRDPILTPLEVSQINAKVQQPDYVNGVKWSSSKKRVYTTKQIDDILQSIEETRPAYTPKEGWSIQPASQMYDAMYGPNGGMGKALAAGKFQLNGEELQRKLADMKYMSFAEILSNPKTGRNWLYQLTLIADPAVLGYDGETVIRVDSNGTRIASDAEINFALDRFSEVAEKFDLNAAPYNSGTFGDTSNRSKPVFYLENGNQALTDEIRSKTGVLGYARPGQIHIIVDRIRNAGEMQDGHFSIDTNKDRDGLLRHVIYHEIGHHFQGINMDYDSPQRDYDHHEHVSKYGKESPAEHFAESFARYMTTGEASPMFRQFLRDRGLLKSQQNN